MNDDTMKFRRESIPPSMGGIAFAAFILAFLSFLFVVGSLLGGARAPRGDRDGVHAMGTANTVAKFTGTASVGNSSATDDGTTFAINTNKFTVTESTGATLAAGNVTFGAAAQILSGGTPTSSAGSVVPGSTNTAGCNTGIGANTALTVTFSTAFANGSFCMAISKTSGSPQLMTIDSGTASLVVTCFNSTTGVATNCNDLCWHCVGR